MSQFSIRYYYFPEKKEGHIVAPNQDNQRVRAEIKQIEKLLFQMGATTILAPIGKSTWQPYRATMPNHKEPLFYGESNFNAKIWQELGYDVAAKYHSAWADNQKQIDSVIALKQRLENEGWMLKSYDPDDSTILQQCHQIANASFANAYCFSPITWKDFCDMYQPLVQQIDPELIVLAYSPDSVLAGFCLAYPDFANPQQQRFILKTLAVAPQFMKRGLGAWMVGEIHQRASEKGFRGGIHAYMWEDSFSTHISKYGGTTIREYRLFKKEKKS